MMNGSLGRNGTTKERDLQFSPCEFEYLLIDRLRFCVQSREFFRRNSVKFWCSCISEEWNRIFGRLTTLSP